MSALINNYALRIQIQYFIVIFVNIIGHKNEKNNIVPQIPRSKT